MLSVLLQRMRRPGSPAQARGRIEICPPSLLRGNALAASGWCAGLRDWLSTSWNASASGQHGNAAQGAGNDRSGDPRFCAVRAEFLAALQDVRSREVAVLRHRIGIAHSLRDLWHFRPEVFKLVALGFSQAEAQCRLDRLNRHFPTRSPRSGFAPLDG
jgi:hypothetical protein